MTKKERMQAVTERLKQVYPEAVCALHYTHDYELLFATRLSAQCTDARVNIVTEKLFSDFPTLERFSRRRARRRSPRISAAAACSAPRRATCTPAR